MAYVIAEPCINTKDTACVEVCPVDCIHPKKDATDFAAETKLYIDPETCIDCGACVPVCPVQAIFPVEELPEKWAHFTKIDASKPYCPAERTWTIPPPHSCASSSVSLPETGGSPSYLN